MNFAKKNKKIELVFTKNTFFVALFTENSPNSL